MSNLIIISQDSHEQLGKFFSDRGTVNHISTYGSIVENETVLKLGTYSVDKLVYINFVTDSEELVQNDMVALTRIFRSPSSFFSINELIIFSLESERLRKIYDNLRVNLEEEVRVRESFRSPEIVVNFVPKAMPYEAIYTNVLGIVREDRKTVKYKNIYRVKTGDERVDVFDPKDYSDDLITPFNYHQVEGYAKLQDIIVKSETGEVILDQDPEEERYLVVDINLTKYTYSQIKRSKYIYFVGDRRVGVTTHLLSVAISLIVSKKSVTILDFSEKPDIIDVLKENGIPYNEISVKEFVGNRVVSNASEINVISTEGLSNESFVKWFRDNPVEFRTDFVLVDFPDKLREWVPLNETIVRVEEMESKNLSNFTPIGTEDVVILSSLFYNSRKCDDSEAKEKLSIPGVSVIVAPSDIRLSRINTRLMEVILKGDIDGS